MPFKSLRRRERPYRVFFATDIHGSDRCFRKFLAAASSYDADALILGGDIAGKAIVPIIEQAGSYTVTFQGQTTTMSEAGLDGLRSRIAFNGLYPFVCDEGEFGRLSNDATHRAALFHRLICDQIRDWRELAAERLRDDVRCIVTPGNDDPLEIDHVLAEPGRFECPERLLVTVGPVTLASLGNTNRTPWDTDREFDEPELAAQINEMLANVNGERLMFNFHCPPFDSGLDTVVQLDSDLRPVISHGQPVEVPVGSTAVGEAIDRYRPGVALHGHIHESAGARRRGSTLCINPGSDYGSGWLKGAIVDLAASGECINHLLTTG